MMKKITSIIFLFLVSVMAFADPVSRNQALQIARDYLDRNENNMLLHARPASDLQLAYECLPRSSRSAGMTAPLYYVFNQGTDNGFVIVAGDDRVTPVLGYVDKGRFSLEKVPENMRWWLQAVEGTMLSVVRSATRSAMPVFMQSATRSQVVEPLITVQWGQGAPYNDQCPDDIYHGDTQKSLVGCVAVSMAQVLHYWQYPLHPTGSVDYVSNEHSMHMIDDLERFTFHWDRMLPAYNDETGTAEQKEAVAELMSACGLAAHMDYCALGSGTYIDGRVFIDHFGMAESARCIQRNYYTRSEWDDVMREELSAGRPVIYSGRTATAGHSFICDGYNADNLFHINWGWNGWMDGYFVLSELNSAAEQAGAPSGEEDCYNFDQRAIIGIQPKGEEPVTPVHTLYYYNIEGGNNPTRSNVAVTVYQIGADEKGFKGIAAIGVFDADGNYVGNMGYTARVDLDPEYFHSSYTFSGPLPENLPDGNYYLWPISQHNGELSGHLMSGRRGAPFRRFLAMRLEGSNVTLSDPNPVKADLKLVSARPLEDKCYMGVSNSFELVIRNDGAMYYGPLTLTRPVDGEELIVYTNSYIFESGEERAIRIQFEGPDSGERDLLSLWMAANDDDDYYSNGCDYSYVQSFDYELTPVKPGNPVFNLEQLQIKNKDIFEGTNLDVEITLSNSGGFYKGPFFLYFYPAEGGSPLGFGKRQIALDGDQSMTFSMEVPTSSLTAGEYVVLAYANNDFVSDEWFHFNVHSNPTGIHEVLNDGASGQQPAYTVSGLRMDRQSKTLPGGVYIIGGKKVLVP